MAPSHSEQFTIIKTFGNKYNAKEQQWQIKHTQKGTEKEKRVPDVFPKAWAKKGFKG